MTTYNIFNIFGLFRAEHISMLEEVKREYPDYIIERSKNEYASIFNLSRAIYKSKLSQRSNVFNRKKNRHATYLT